MYTILTVKHVRLRALLHLGNSILQDVCLIREGFEFMHDDLNFDLQDTQSNERAAHEKSASSALDLSLLNDEQREAVLCTEGPLLVLAGAGSGKTRVLTHRIAYLVEEKGIAPWQILAITFTNKAAKEMRERVAALLGGRTRGMWVSTFHAMCVRILRDDADKIGYDKNFSIYDTDDLKRLVKPIMIELDADPKQISPAVVLSQISQAKNALMSPADLHKKFEGTNSRGELIADVYERLERRLKNLSAMDFDDLLLKCHELFSKYPEVLESYQERFRYILVDEYQDTNAVQYALTNMLARKYKNLMVVGDDDQSIYSWRGADISNILSFKKDYPDAHLVKLEQNYRSTGHILSAANAVVSHNARREKKALYTKAGAGAKVEVFQAQDDRDEGRWIGAEIEKLHDNGTAFGDMAVFYRTNAQSRILEDMLLRAGVPYKIVGGTRFFDRAEIRDVMAYLKAIVNPRDDVSVMRIINVPRRGIGQTSIEKIQAYAQAHNCSFFQACEVATSIESDVALTSRIRAQLDSFVNLIKEEARERGSLEQIVSSIIEKTHLIEAHLSEHSVDGESRAENVREFVSVAAEFEASHDDMHEVLESLSDLKKAGVIDSAQAPAADSTPASNSNSAADSTPALAFGSDAAEALASAPSPAPSAPEAAQDLDAPSEKLEAFIEWLSLRSDLDTLMGESSAVTLMTVHAAKGLEFPIVFVAGMEDGIFPHTGFEKSDCNIEEERRLAYVAITRARKKLFLTHARVRHVFGTVAANPKSRFLDEIKDEDLHLIGAGSDGFTGVGWEKRGDRHATFGSGRAQEVYGGHIFGSATRSSNTRHSSSMSSFSAPTAPTSADTNFVPGDRVMHKIFGKGIVKHATTDTVEVYFEKSGKVKKLLKGFAPLTRIS